MMSLAEPLTELESQLLPEAALAVRIIRNAHVPRQLLAWLSHPERSGEWSDEFGNAPLTALIRELVDSILDAEAVADPIPAPNAVEYLSAICQHHTAFASEFKLERGTQLLASGLLPVYRGLATHDLQQCFEQARYRLLENLTILALGREMGPGLASYMDRAHAHSNSPAQVLGKVLGCDIASTAFLMGRLVFDFDEQAEDFHDSVYERLWGFDAQQLSSLKPRVPDWAAPELLWQLADDFTSDRPALLIPRPWISTHLPWQAAGKHWQQLTAILETEACTGTRRAGAVRDGTALHSESKKNTMKTEAQTEKTKLLISEILTDHDPAFITSIQGHVDRSRMEARSLSLAAIEVHRQNGQSIAGEARTGPLQTWHHRLLNRIGDHPDVGDSCAFVTPDAKLYVCVWDLERTEISRLLRSSLSRILGIEAESRPGRTLNSKKVPACYFGGLASVANASPNLTSAQLIEATLRCLAAANGGRASAIKSIEVY